MNKIGLILTILMLVSCKQNESVNQEKATVIL